MLPSDATVVGDAIRFVSEHSSRFNYESNNFQKDEESVVLE
jgi:hypothetical protein